MVMTSSSSNNNNFPKKKPSQLKCDFERKQEFIKTKVKFESNKDGDDIEEKLKHKEVTGKKKLKKLRCKIASHMGSAAESVLKLAVAKYFSYNMGSLGVFMSSKFLLKTKLKLMQS